MNSTYAYRHKYETLAGTQYETLYGYRLSVRGIPVKEEGFATVADAGWASDKARRLLAPFIGKTRRYNFPDRVRQMTESEMGEVSPALLAFFLELNRCFPALANGYLQTPTVSPAPVSPAPVARGLSVTQLADLRALIASASHKRDVLLSCATGLRAAFGAYPEGRLGTTLSHFLKQAARLDIEISGLEKRLPEPVVSPLDTETT